MISIDKWDSYQCQCKYLEEMGVSLLSVTEQIDTRSATGKLVFHLFSALAEFGRNLISERTKEGLNAARRRGSKGGRKPALVPKAIQQVRTLIADRSTSPADICKQFKVSKSTLYKVVRQGVQQ